MSDPIFEVMGSVESIDADMLDVSQFGDPPGSRHVAGELRVGVRTGAGTFRIPWSSVAPAVGERVRISIHRVEG